MFTLLKKIYKLTALAIVLGMICIFNNVDCTSADNTLKTSYENVEIPFADHPGFEYGGYDFSNKLHREDDSSFSIKDFKGSVVVVLLSTLWCTHCPQALQSLDDLQKRNIPNLKVVALNIGKDELYAIAAHYNKYQIKFLDICQSVSPDAILGLQGVPKCMIFDPNGRPVCSFTGGGIDYNSSRFIRFIKELQALKLII